MVDRRERQPLPQPNNPLEVINELKRKGNISEIMLTQWISGFRDEGEVPTIHSEVWIAPTKPAETIGELNALAEALPQPDNQLGKRAMFDDKYEHTELPVLNYLREAGLIEFNPPSVTVYEGGCVELVCDAIAKIRQPIEIKHVVTVRVFPTDKIAQAVAQQQYEILLGRNRKSREEGVSEEYRVLFDPSRPAVDLSHLTDREISWMDYAISRQVWDPRDKDD